MENETQPAPKAPALSGAVFWIVFILIAIAGVWARVNDTASYRRTGFDEFIYRRYVLLMDGGKQIFSVPQQDKTMKRYEVTIQDRGAAALPKISALYLATQKQPNAMCELPPTRFVYLYSAWLWKNLRFGDEPPLSLAELQTESGDKPDDVPFAKDCSHRDPALAALNQVSCGFSILLMLAGGLFAWRMLGRGAGLGVLGLMAFDPLQLHFSQHAMIDGIFSFWALMCLWTTWECLRAPKSVGWLVAHTVCLALMVMTKENAFFVFCALAAVVVANRWLKFGTVTPRFLLLSVAGPALGLAVLILLAGGMSEFIAVFQAFIAKAHDLAFTEKFGDGPWYRYLLDLLILSPIVLCLALGALFALSGRRKEVALLAIFVGVSYLIMCNLRNGMNLRFAGIWGFPLRAAAFLMIWEVCARFGSRQWLVAAMLTGALCAYEGRQYLIMNANPKNPFYEVIPEQMLRQVQIIKAEKKAEPKAPAPSAPPVPSTPAEPADPK